MKAKKAASFETAFFIESKWKIIFRFARLEPFYHLL